MLYMFRSFLIVRVQMSIFYFCFRTKQRICQKKISKNPVKSYPSNIMNYRYIVNDVCFAQQKVLGKIFSF